MPIIVSSEVGRQGRYGTFGQGSPSESRAFDLEARPQSRTTGMCGIPDVWQN